MFYPRTVVLGVSSRLLRNDTQIWPNKVYSTIVKVSDSCSCHKT